MIPTAARRAWHGHHGAPSSSRILARSRRSPICKSSPGMNRTLNKTLADDLVRPLFRTSVWFFAVMLAAGTVVACGAAAWGYQLWYGIGVSGKRWPTFWALYLTNFVFWIGISHAGTLISAILRLVNAGWRRPVTHCAEVITVFALMIGAM